MGVKRKNVLQKKKQNLYSDMETKILFILNMAGVLTSLVVLKHFIFLPESMLIVHTIINTSH